MLRFVLKHANRKLWENTSFDPFYWVDTKIGVHLGLKNVKIPKHPETLQKSEIAFLFWALEQF